MAIDRNVNSGNSIAETGSTSNARTRGDELDQPTLPRATSRSTEGRADLRDRSSPSLEDSVHSSQYPPTAKPRCSKQATRRYDEVTHWLDRSGKLGEAPIDLERREDNPTKIALSENYARSGRREMSRLWGLFACLAREPDGRATIARSEFERRVIRFGRLEIYRPARQIAREELQLTQICNGSARE